MTDPTDPADDLLAAATAKGIDAIMRQVSAALDEMWARPDAPAIVSGFIAHRVVFVVDATGITFAERADPPPPDEQRAAQPADTPPAPTGHYL
jgi:hypothetical protein